MAPLQSLHFLCVRMGAFSTHPYKIFSGFLDLHGGGGATEAVPAVLLSYSFPSWGKGNNCSRLVTNGARPWDSETNKRQHNQDSDKHCRQRSGDHC